MKEIVTFVTRFIANYFAGIQIIDSHSTPQTSDPAQLNVLYIRQEFCDCAPTIPINVPVPV